MTPSQRTTLAVSGTIAGLAPLIGNGLYAGPVDDSKEILDVARDGLPAIGAAAYALELVGFVALAVLLGWLVALLFERTPVAAATTGVLGGTMVAVKIGFVAPVLALRLNPDAADAASAVLFTGIGEGAFIVSGLLLGACLCAAGIGLRATELAGWRAWWPTMVGALGVITAMIGFVSPQAYVPIPFLLLFVWMAAVGIAAAMSSKDSRTSGSPVLG